MKLLIVDDHVLFREGLASIIRSDAEIEIVGLVGSVQDAIEMAGKTKPDIILMDFNLPDGTGADATRAILDVHPKCGIVFLTMSEKDDNLLTAIRSGGKGYLLKDMHPAKLINAIKAVQRGESAISRSMTLKLMEELSHGGGRSEAPASLNSPTLTRRELDVLGAIASGMSNQEIANRFVLSENTVKYHVHSILEKLQLKDRREAAAYARDHGLVSKDQ
jgi:DNA-binding NarL/FixJ family response regulator